MRVTVLKTNILHDEPATQFKDYPVTTHILQSDPLNPDLFHYFHCWKCGRGVIQINAHVGLSIPGGAPVHLPTMVECRTCKQRHLFSSVL